MDLEAREFSVSRWRAAAADLLLRQLLLGRAAPAAEPWLRRLETSSSSFSSLGSLPAALSVHLENIKGNCKREILLWGSRNEKLCYMEMFSKG